MKIAIVVGSRADKPGLDAIESELIKLGVEIGSGPSCEVIQCLMPDIDAAILLGDRAEVLLEAVDCREENIPIIHIHAGETTGQEPDDSYRYCISKLATWCFVPHKEAYEDLVFKEQFGAHDGKQVFNCGSPYITSASNTKLINTHEEGFWPEGNERRIFVAFNPLPEKPVENAEIIEGLMCANLDKYRTLIVAPNTDRGNEELKEQLAKMGKMIDGVSHTKYLSLMADCDVMVGNSSSMCIEASHLGTPCVLVGSRQRYRKKGSNVIHCEPQNIKDAMQNAFKKARRPCTPYGDIDSAKNIAEKIVEVLSDR